MKIAFLVTALDKQGPIFVVKDLIENLIKNHGLDIEIFYFDEKEECIDFFIPKTKLNFFSSFNFSEFNLVHSHGIRPDIFLMKNNINIKKISTQHNIIFEQYNITYNFFTAKFIEFFWINFLKDKDVVVGIGGVAKNYYAEKLKNKVVSIDNGRNPILINDLCFEDSQIFSEIKSKFKIIGACTRLVRLKGHEQLIKALKFLPDYYLVLVGDGDFKKHLQELSQKENVSDRCLFLGYRENPNSYLPFFDIYAMTSYTESVSIALLEAASAGKSIVCSNIDVNKDIFSEDEVSFFEINNISSLVESIKNATNNSHKFSKSALNAFEVKYTSEIMAKKYYQLYVDVLRPKAVQL